MRYLGQFPTEKDIVDHIIYEIKEDEPGDYISFSGFEKFMENAMLFDTYAPNNPEVLLAAFKMLDEDGTGEIECELMYSYLSQMGNNFSKDEVKLFKEFIYGVEKTKDTFHYEDYIHKWKIQVDKHRYDYLEKELEDYNPEIEKRKKEERKMKR